MVDFSLVGRSCINRIIKPAHLYIWATSRNVAGSIHECHCNFSFT